MKYLIYAKHIGSEKETLSAVATSRNEVTGLKQLYRLSGMTARAVTKEDFFKGCSLWDEKICKVLRELSVSEDSYVRKANVFSVEITGDWKHDHARCDNILTKLLSCTVVNEKTTWQDGSDYYTSIHSYRLNKVDL